MDRTKSFTRVVTPFIFIIGIMVVKSKSRIIGYARVSSGNQNLDTQLDRLQKHGCDKIYQEKISGVDQNRPALLSCLDYLRDGDTLVITRLDRMARSAVHLGQIAEKLKHKDVNLVVLEQNIKEPLFLG